MQTSAAFTTIDRLLKLNLFRANFKKLVSILASFFWITLDLSNLWQAKLIQQLKK